MSETVTPKRTQFAEETVTQLDLQQMLYHMRGTGGIPHADKIPGAQFMAQWADEMADNIDPRPNLEDFYTLAALQLGDPDGPLWLHQHLPAFRELYETYCHQKGFTPEDSNAIVLSYFFWYPKQPVGHKFDTPK